MRKKVREYPLSAGHRELNQIIERDFGGSKVLAAEAAEKLQFPTSGSDDLRLDLVKQTITKLSNGYVKRPSIERMFWLQDHWGIDLEAWTEP